MLIFINCVLFHEAKTSDYNKNADMKGWINVDKITNGSHVRNDSWYRSNYSVTQTIIKSQGQIIK